MKTAKNLLLTFSLAGIWSLAIPVATMGIDSSIPLVSTASVPEPATLALLVIGSLAFIIKRRNAS